jgi:hypothetical protein
MKETIGILQGTITEILLQSEESDIEQHHQYHEEAKRNKQQIDILEETNSNQKASLQTLGKKDARLTVGQLAFTFEEELIQQIDCGILGEIRSMEDLTSNLTDFWTRRNAGGDQQQLKALRNEQQCVEQNLFTVESTLSIDNDHRQVNFHFISL